MSCPRSYFVDHLYFSFHTYLLGFSIKSYHIYLLPPTCKFLFYHSEFPGIMLYNNFHPLLSAKMLTSSFYALVTCPFWATYQSSYLLLMDSLFWSVLILYSLSASLIAVVPPLSCGLLSQMLWICGWNHLKWTLRTYSAETWRVFFLGREWGWLVVF